MQANLECFTPQCISDFYEGVLRLDTLVRSRGVRFVGVPGFEHSFPFEDALTRLLFEPPCTSIRVLQEPRGSRRGHLLAYRPPPVLEVHAASLGAPVRLASNHQQLTRAMGAPSPALPGAPAGLASSHQQLAQAVGAPPPTSLGAPVRLASNHQQLTRAMGAPSPALPGAPAGLASSHQQLAQAVGAPPPTSLGAPVRLASNHQQLTRAMGAPSPALPGAPAGLASSHQQLAQAVGAPPPTSLGAPVRLASNHQQLTRAMGAPSPALPGAPAGLAPSHQQLAQAVGAPPPTSLGAPVRLASRHQQLAHAMGAPSPASLGASAQVKQGPQAFAMGNATPALSAPSGVDGVLWPTLDARDAGNSTRATTSSVRGCEDSPSGELSRFESSPETAGQQGGVRLGIGEGSGPKGSATRPCTEYPSRVRLGRGGDTSPAAQGLVQPSSLLLGGGTCCQGLDSQPGTEYPLCQPLTHPPSASDPSTCSPAGGSEVVAQPPLTASNSPGLPVLAQLAAIGVHPDVDVEPLLRDFAALHASAFRHKKLMRSVARCFAALRSWSLGYTGTIYALPCSPPVHCAIRDGSKAFETRAVGPFSPLRSAVAGDLIALGGVLPTLAVVLAPADVVPDHVAAWRKHGLLAFPDMPNGIAASDETVWRYAHRFYRKQYRRHQQFVQAFTADHLAVAVLRVQYLPRESHPFPWHPTYKQIAPRRAGGAARLSTIAEVVLPRSVHLSPAHKAPVDGVGQVEKRKGRTGVTPLMAAPSSGLEAQPPRTTEIPKAGEFTKQLSVELQSLKRVDDSSPPTGENLPLVPRATPTPCTVSSAATAAEPAGAACHGLPASSASSMKVGVGVAPEPLPFLASAGTLPPPQPPQALPKPFDQNYDQTLGDLPMRGAEQVTAAPVWKRAAFAEALIMDEVSVPTDQDARDMRTQRQAAFGTVRSIAENLHAKRAVKATTRDARMELGHRTPGFEACPRLMGRGFGTWFQEYVDALAALEGTGINQQVLGLRATRFVRRAIPPFQEDLSSASSVSVASSCSSVASIDLGASVASTCSLSERAEPGLGASNNPCSASEEAGPWGFSPAIFALSPGACGHGRGGRGARGGRAGGRGGFGRGGGEGASSPPRDPASYAEATRAPTTPLAEPRTVQSVNAVLRPEVWPELRNVCHHNVQYILAAIGWVPASVRKYKGEKEDHQTYARRVQRARDLSPVELEDLDMARKKIRKHCTAG